MQPAVAESQPQPVFALNTQAAALLERWCQQHGHDPADVVNAAMVCTLSGFAAARRTLGECLQDAEAERLGANAVALFEAPTKEAGTR